MYFYRNSWLLKLLSMHKVVNFKQRYSEKFEITWACPSIWCAKKILFIFSPDHSRAREGAPEAAGGEGADQRHPEENQRGANTQNLQGGHWEVHQPCHDVRTCTERCLLKAACWNTGFTGMHILKLYRQLKIRQVFPLASSWKMGCHWVGN